MSDNQGCVTRSRAEN